MRRRSLFGLKVLDPTADRFVRGPRTRVLHPAPFTSQLEASQIYRWAQRLDDVCEILVYCPHPEAAVTWWENVPGWVEWARDLSQAPRCGLLPVVRRQRDLDVLEHLQVSQFPSRKMLVQAFPEEEIYLPSCLQLDGVFVGAESSEWFTTTPMQPTWLIDLAKQCAQRGVPLRMLGWSGWWPPRAGFEVWQEKDGMCRGPRQPLPPYFGEDPPWLIR